MRIIGIAFRSQVFQRYLFRVSWVASDKLQNFIIQFELYYLSSGRLREVRNKRKLLVLKSGRGRLREVVAMGGLTVLRSVSTSQVTK